MSIDNKYGVPISTQIDERGALLQPKFVNRFRVFFFDMGETLSDQNDSAKYLTAQVESFSRPSIEYSNKPVNSFNGRGFISGRPMFGEVKFVIRDEITNTAIAYIYRHLQRSIDKLYPQMRDGNTVKLNQQLGRNTKFTIRMEVLDGRTNHSPLEVWEFNGCLFNSINFTDNSYEDDTEIFKVTVSCTFDGMNVFRPERTIFGSRENDDKKFANTEQVIDERARIVAETQRLTEPVNRRVSNIIRGIGL